MTEIQTPTRVKPTQEARPQASLWHRLSEHLNDFKQEAVMGLGCISAAAVFAMTLGKQEKASASPYMSEATPDNIGGVINIESPLSKQEVKSELRGPQVLLACIYPSDVRNCEMDRVRAAGEGMQNFLKHPNHGAPGFSMRIAMKDGQMVVVPIQLDKTTAEIVDMSKDDDSQAGREAFSEYFENQVYSKVETSPDMVIAGFLSGTPPLGDEGEHTCSEIKNWGGIFIDRRVMLESLASNCDSVNDFDGYRAPHVRMLSDIIHNDGYIDDCEDAFINTQGQRGFSSALNDVLAPSVGPEWWKRRLGPYFRPGQTEGCRNLADDADSRFAWQVSAIGGQGSIEYRSPDGSIIKLDPGNRLQAGLDIEVLYKRAPGENFLGWSGSGKGATIRELRVNEPIELRAKVGSMPQTKKYEVAVTSKGFSIIGMGQRCIESCKKKFRQGTDLELRAAPLEKYRNKIKFMGWVGCNKVIKRATGLVCKIDDLKANRNIVGKSKSLATVKN